MTVAERRIATLMARIVEAAQSRRWTELAALDQECQRLVDWLARNSDREGYAEALTRLLELYRDTRQSLVAYRSDCVERLSGFRSGQEQSRAYQVVQSLD